MGGQPQLCPRPFSGPGLGELADFCSGKGWLGQRGQQARITLDTQKGKGENKQTEAFITGPG